MGAAEKTLSNVADQGTITDKVVTSLISQLGVLQGVFLVATNSFWINAKVTNSFAWVGGMNQATGATDALSGGLDGLQVRCVSHLPLSAGPSK
ncbi:hypothetical protein ACL655_22220 [Klebsiella quasipneumoniae subsp. similipneumoniae]